MELSESDADDCDFGFEITKSRISSMYVIRITNPLGIVKYENDKLR